MIRAVSKKKLGGRVDFIPWGKIIRQAMWWRNSCRADRKKNSPSATNNTAESLRNPKLVPEYEGRTRTLSSVSARDAGNQWFGELLGTTKGLGNTG